MYFATVAFLLTMVTTGTNEQAIEGITTKVDLFLRSEGKNVSAILPHWARFTDVALEVGRIEDVIDARGPVHLAKLPAIVELDRALLELEGKLTEFGVCLGDVQGWIRTMLNRSGSSASEKGSLRQRLDLVDAAALSIVREARSKLDILKIACAHRKTELIK